MSQPFYEIQFPVSISAGALAVIGARTRIYEGDSGDERRFRRWSHPLRRFDASRGVRRVEDYELVRAFHLIVGGAHVGFRFQDFSDYLIENETIDTSGGGTTFQLVRSYTFGAYSYKRPIKKPCAGTFRITLNDAPLYVGGDGPVFGEQLFGEPEADATVTIDTTTGIITTSRALTGADTLVIKRGEFDVPARFASDDLGVRAMPRGKTWEYEPIEVKEIRV